MTDGFLNILKPPGMSSHDVVAFVRRLFQIKKVGHAGTLDPAAAGVLPVALGKATRLIEYMADADKAYRTELTFGVKTDSGDDTGKPVEVLADFTMPDEAALKAALMRFEGEIEQVPPMYSAIKLHGQKLCDLARQGIVLERPKRQVRIYALKLLKCYPDKILFDVHCSKGTYIRSLCMDIGDMLRIPATMSFLIRTQVGSFGADDAVTLEELAVQRDAALLPIDSVILHLMPVYLSAEQALAFQQGRKLRWLDAGIGSTATVRVYDDRKTFIGIGSADGYRIVPEKVFVR